MKKDCLILADTKKKKDPTILTQYKQMPMNVFVLFGFKDFLTSHHSSVPTWMMLGCWRRVGWPTNRTLSIFSSNFFPHMSDLVARMVASIMSENLKERKAKQVRINECTARGEKERGEQGEISSVFSHSCVCARGWMQLVCDSTVRT